MTDPVVCVDGFSYERSNIENWFATQSANRNGQVTFTSPVTGEVLQSRLIIKNINLAKAISQFIPGSALHLKPSAPALEEKSTGFVPAQSSRSREPTVESLQFSRWSLGKAVTLEEHSSVAVKSAMHADVVDWYEYIAISDFPSRYTPDQKPRACFLIEASKTGWGGLCLGFCPESPDKIKAAEVKDYLDANAWWLDGSKWFHSPDGGAVLVNWSTDQLRPGDRVGITVPSQGRFCLYVNGVIKVDLKDTGLPVKVGTQLYGFVGLTGGYEKVRIVQEIPSDWSE
jgi:hypothetical protein